MNEEQYRNQLQDYRKLCIESEQKAQEDYDKTILSLSGGALGISFAFVKDIVGNQPIICSLLLFAAWISWVASLAIMLFSFYFSVKAFRKTIIQLDDGKLHNQQPGGIYSRLTAISNSVGGILFLVGVVLIFIFVGYNLR